MDAKNKKILLSIDNLSVQFKIGLNKRFDAVKKVSLDIYQGEIVGLVGESGSGKSTLGKSIMGINKHSGGQIILNNEIIPPEPKYIKAKINQWLSKNVQMIFQDAKASLNPRTNVLDAVSEGAKNQKLHLDSKKDKICKIKKFFEKCGDKYINAWRYWQDKYEYAKMVLELESKFEANKVYINAFSEYKKSYFKYKSIKFTYKTSLHQEKNHLMETIMFKKEQPGDKGVYKKRLIELKTKYKQDLALIKKEILLNKGKFRDAKKQSEYIKKLYCKIIRNTKYGYDLKVEKFKQNKHEYDSLNEEYKNLRGDVFVKDTIRKSIFYKNLVIKTLKEVAIPSDFLNRYSTEFSGGQNQRIAIARSLILNPNLIVADEPISALDVSIQAQVINLLKKLVREKQLTLLFVAHDLQSVKYISDRIAVMYRGEIVEVGSADEVYNNPIHPYTKSLVAAVPSINDSSKILKITKYRPNFIPQYVDRGNKQWVNISESHKVFVYKKEMEDLTLANKVVFAN